MRLITADDAGALTHAVVRHRDFLTPWEPQRTESFYTEAGQRQILASSLTEQDADRARFWLLLDGAQVVGRMSLTDVVLGAFCNGHLGYWVAEEHQGQGVATAAVAQVCNVATVELGLHRLQAATLVHNAASQRVLARNGFQEIGTAPDYLKIDGKWQDHILFQRILAG